MKERNTFDDVTLASLDMGTGTGGTWTVLLVL